MTSQTSIFDTMGDLFEQTPVKNRISDPEQKKPTKWIAVELLGTSGAPNDKPLLKNGRFGRPATRKTYAEFDTEQQAHDAAHAAPNRRKRGLIWITPKI